MIKQAAGWIYAKLAKENDSPQRIAIGFALGVFLGILPGVGPVASLALAYCLRVNRAAALAGSLLTNTWISVVTFVLAAKIGAAACGVAWTEIYDAARQVFVDFHWQKLFDTSLRKILRPLLIGYGVIGLVLAAAAYGAALAVLLTRSRKS